MKPKRKQGKMDAGTTTQNPENLKLDDDDVNNSNIIPMLPVIDKRSKPNKAKVYNPKWESDPVLKTWVQRYPSDKGKVFCPYCPSLVRSHKNDLMQHTSTLQHQRNYQQNTEPEVFNSFVMELNNWRGKMCRLPRKRKSNRPESEQQLHLDEYLPVLATSQTPDSNLVYNLLDPSQPGSHIGFKNEVDLLEDYENCLDVQDMTKETITGEVEIMKEVEIQSNNQPILSIKGLTAQHVIHAIQSGQFQLTEVISIHKTALKFVEEMIVP